MTLKIAVVPAAPEDEARASTLATRLALPVAEVEHERPSALPQWDALLIVAGQELSLQECGRHAPGPVRVDFGAGAMRHRRRGGHNELLGRALGIGGTQSFGLVDATAGLGRDSFVLADLGCRVVMCEREPLVSALLEAGLHKALASDDDWLRSRAERLSLFCGDARDLPAQPRTARELIYLDPMFPSRNKRAAVKKDMALFQRLLEDRAQDEGAELLDWALAQPAARVVVKRPLRAEPLAGQKPSHALRGKAVRYDVYVLRALNIDCQS